MNMKLTLNLLSHLSALGDIILLWLKTFLECSRSWGVSDANRRNTKRFFSAGLAQQAFPLKHRGQKISIICTLLISEIEDAPRSSHRHLYSNGVSVCHALTPREKMKNNERRLLISASDYICMSSPEESLLSALQQIKFPTPKICHSVYYTCWAALLWQTN